MSSQPSVETLLEQIDGIITRSLPSATMSQIDRLQQDALVGVRAATEKLRERRDEHRYVVWMEACRCGQSWKPGRPCADWQAYDAVLALLKGHTE